MSSTVVPAPGSRTSEVVKEGSTYAVNDLFGRFDEARPGPQAFLVDVVEVGGPIRPHYHEVDQYQVVVGGSGVIGKKALGPGVVHYTDSYTSYGPIISDDTGLAFLTLRAQANVGSKYMPESRDLKTTRSGESFEVPADIAMPVRATTVASLAATGDGAEARQWRVAPGDPVPALEAAALAREAYLVVVAGEFSRSGSAVLPVGSCVHHLPGTDLPSIHAGAAGGVMVFLAFADQASERSRPGHHGDQDGDDTQ